MQWSMSKSAEQQSWKFRPRLSSRYLNQSLNPEPRSNPKSEWQRSRYYNYGQHRSRSHFYSRAIRVFCSFGQLHSVAEDLSNRARRVAQLFGRSSQLRSIRSDREIFPFPFSANGSSYTRVHGIVANILINSKICQSSKRERSFLSQKSVQPSPYSLFSKICQP